MFSIADGLVGAATSLEKDVGDHKAQVERAVKEAALSELAKQAVWRARTKRFAWCLSLDLLMKTGR